MKAGRSSCSRDMLEVDAGDAIDRAVDIYEVLVEVNSFEER
jgi:hypothetical protein